jgi:hypothetical protein
VLRFGDLKSGRSAAAFDAEKRLCMTRLNNATGLKLASLSGIACNGSGDRSGKSMRCPTPHPSNRILSLQSCTMLERKMAVRQDVKAG